MEWLDKPNQKRLSAEINGEKVALHVGNCAIGLFRQRPDMDYLAFKDEEEAWTLCFNKGPLIYWMGGLAIGTEAQRQQQVMERNNGDFYERFGWNASVVVDDYPSDWEVDTYLEFLAHDNDDLHADLSKALEENEDD